MRNLRGERLGRYEIQDELGRGGMARVYRAEDTLLRRPVAIKVLAAQLSMDSEFVRRFEREARTAAALRHPNIITIYDVGEAEGFYYIAMELINGRSLHSILTEQSALGLGYAISLLDPIAQALDFAHAQGAVHRDVKPHNIMLDRQGRVVLADFGIAQTPDADSERLTRTGVFMGTPEYISPEQAEARRVDGQSDLYSLGVVAYEIITGRVPFSGATPQLIVSHAQLPPPPPTSVVAHLPSELDLVLARALAKRPQGRYPNGTAMVAALREVAQRYQTPIATREQLAALIDPLVATDQTIPQAVGPAPRPAPRPADPAPAPHPAPRLADPAPDPRSPEPRPVPVPRPLPEHPSGQSMNTMPVLAIGGVLVVLTLLILFFVAQRFAGGSPPALPTATSNLPSPTIAIPLGSPTVTPTPSPTAVPTATPSPTLTPEPPPPTLPPPPPVFFTAVPPTAVPPTDTPVPPTDTPVPPTDTPVPPTDTPVPPTDTPVPPTDTPVPPTDTPVPPTDTPVSPTDVPVPPTDVPPTDVPPPVPPTEVPTPTV
ncbi:protein kinase [Oscillochloris trichoides DG-6]|uniref:non-specific serine/threonine protein kinase n=1 Tax=Oscillochloris trichoides DG-6 TaxID=765420 RepID=E1IEI8_9CHLR|nr:serine/threonine-protein kinase [Oscillochloris trichoides]EFO80380.1 protein kinase [Oscillochloris trichoides DG-6]